ncbi:hypothetical protein [Nitrosomonas marina]|uniref:hypothetical protein n=1 Tax=Nitrosomonas marina TaxID=917 RepID=UPI00115FA930|nr:hypothetical protein [Nitrosomonas marina]
MNTKTPSRLIYASQIVFKVIVLGLLIGCEPQIDEKACTKNIELTHAVLNQHSLYIPLEYLKFIHTSVGNESALLQTWYPGGNIVPNGTPLEFIKEDVWWKNIRVLITSKRSAIPFGEFAQKTITHLEATELVGNEYGLIHYKQPENEVQDHSDVWVEKNEKNTVSYIICSEHITKNDRPQCENHFFMNEKFWIKISYSRKLLSDWKNLKDNVINMIDSFEKPDTAQFFLANQINYHKSCGSKETL